MSKHTVVWALFAVGILAIPVVAFAHHFQLAAWLSAAVLVEVVVIFRNRWRCPLSDVAAHFTADRADNFDIYLPLWLARYNKQIFGPLFVVGGAVALGAWLHSRRRYSGDGRGRLASAEESPDHSLH